MARVTKKGTATKGTLKEAPYVALLRGINVGGKNMLPMKDLIALFDRAGCSDVKSYIQSGNIVFRAPPALAARLPPLIEKAIQDGFGLRVPVVLRSADQLRAIAKNNGFLQAGSDVDIGTLHVVFLADQPRAGSLAALDPARSPPDRFIANDQEIYLHCPNGLARTKLTNQYFDTKLSTTSTVRNWRTLLKLIEMAGAKAES